MEGQTTITIEDVLAQENIEAAMEHLMSHGNLNASGPDGVPLEELPTYWEQNGGKICEMIRNKGYVPGVVDQFRVISRTGKERWISRMDSVDRLLCRAVAQQLTVVLEPVFADCSFAYRTGRGTTEAVARACDYMTEGKGWVAEIDIKNFFDTIPHERMLNKLHPFVGDKALWALLLAYIRCEIQTETEIARLRQGLQQGSALSPVLSNLYLTELDRMMEKQGYACCRFGDDINIYCRTQQEAVEARRLVEHHLHSVERLAVNRDKAGVFRGINRRYLGFTFEQVGEQVISKKVVYTKKGIYYNWHRTAVQKVDRHYHIINDGILTQKDYNLLFENEEKKYYLPVETMDSLNIYSNVTFGSRFFEFVGKKGLHVTLFDRFGNKVGGFVPKNHRRDVKVEIAQIALLASERSGDRVEMGRKLEAAGIFNLRAILRYYQRRRESESLKEGVSELTEAIEALQSCDSVDQLMMVEARARQAYYRHMNDIIDVEGFRFIQRTKRPPRDQLNSMISFGNTLVYQRIAGEIYKSPLDIRFGIIHSSLKRAESLNLDLADLFKPVLVDRTIFTLINRRMLDVNRDFREIEDGGVYMSNQGKRLFVEEFERKLYQKVQVGKEHITYDTLLRREVWKLVEYFRSGKKYKPFKYMN